MLESEAEVPALSLEQPTNVIALPASNPVMAAEMISVLVVRFIALFVSLFWSLMNGVVKGLPLACVCRLRLQHLTEK